MQPVSGQGTPATGERSVASSASTLTSTPPTSTTSDQPLTLAQRTTLDTLVTKLQALTSLTSTSIWNSVRQELGLTPNASLLTQHFQPAEQSLQTRVTQAQQDPQRQPLLQRLTELLPQGNNRALVSQFIRQEFGHTELNALSQPQLQRVLAMVQHALGAPTGFTAPTATTTTSTTPFMTTPNVATAAILERPLSSAEQSGLNQLVVRLAALSGEQPGKIWSMMMGMQNLAPGTPIPVKHLPLLTHYVQTQTALAQQLTAGGSQGDIPVASRNSAAATLTAQSAPLALLQSIIQPGLDANELQLLQDYSQNRFNAGLQAPLTALQLNEVVTFLFAQRLQRPHETRWADAITFPQPLLNPLFTALPPEWQALFHKPMFWPIVGACVVVFLLWLLV